MKLQSERPNVVFISTDQMRADFMSCNGHPVVMTPQMDELACEGINFQKAFSECPVCVPARRIMMTGLNSYNIHMDHNQSAQPFPEGPKFAALMTAAGYQTVSFGKLHTNPPRNRIGFEECVINEEGRLDRFPDDYERYMDEQGLRHEIYAHGVGNNQYALRINSIDARHTTTRWTAMRAAEFLERRDPTRPFFMHLSFDKPHPPITPTPEAYELYRNVEMPAPVHAAWEKTKLPTQTLQQCYKNNMDVYKDHPVNTQQVLRGYAALITEIDSALGMFFGTLREHKLLDNTILVFTSDHGDCMFDHEHTAKVNFWRGSAGIPYIIRPSKEWARLNGFRMGTVDQETPANLADIMPTVLEMCGVAVPEGIDGQSLVPVMLGEDRSTAFRALSFGNCYTIFTANDGKYKYVWYSDDDYEYLFDTDTDKNDQYDLIDDPAYRETADRLRRGLAAWIHGHGDDRSDGARLIQKDHDWKVEQAKHRTSWNNRGRH